MAVGTHKSLYAGQPSEFAEIRPAAKSAMRILSSGSGSCILEPALSGAREGPKKSRAGGTSIQDLSPTIEGRCFMPAKERRIAP